MRGITKATRRCTVLFALSLISFSAHASPKDELEKVKHDLKQSQERQVQLSNQDQKLEAELKALQATVVKLAESIQRTEATLQELEDKLRELNEDLKEKGAALKIRRKHLNALVQAALSLSHTPPEAMLMMPGDVTQTIKTARTLKMTSDSIRQEVEAIGLQIQELQKLKEQVTQNRNEAAHVRAQLDKERQNLSAELANRLELQKKIGLERQQEAEKLAILAKKAQDLKELITSIEREQAQRKALNDKKAADITSGQAKLKSFTGAKSRIRLPAVGDIVQSFGSSQNRNATSKGVILATQSNAQVVAPYDGEVVFTGPFLAYGQMVIIRHSDDFHTLLAGLRVIDVNPGEFLLEGEPIGAMGESDSARRLYIELRKNNQPVDPALWIKGLNKKAGE